MTLLIAGLFLWSGAHLLPSMAVGMRAKLVGKLGLRPYKGCFALLIIVSIILMVLGWRGTVPVEVYTPPYWGRHVTYLLVLLTFILFVAARRKTNIKRLLRHPQLTGLVLWSIGHLLVNGDNRSLALFTWLGIWAILEMTFINRRTGTWIKPEPVPVTRDIMTVVIGAILYAVIFMLHPYITGIRLVTV